MRVVTYLMNVILLRFLFHDLLRGYKVVVVKLFQELHHEWILFLSSFECEPLWVILFKVSKRVENGDRSVGKGYKLVIEADHGIELFDQGHWVVFVKHQILGFADVFSQFVVFAVQLPRIHPFIGVVVRVFQQLRVTVLIFLNPHRPHGR